MRFRMSLNNELLDLLTIHPSKELQEMLLAVFPRFQLVSSVSYLLFVFPEVFVFVKYRRRNTLL